MNIYTVKYHVETYHEGAQIKKAKSLEIRLPSTVQEIPLLKWVKYLQLAKESPQITDTSEQVTVTNWIQFVAFAKQVIELFSGQDLSEAIAGIPASQNAQNGIIAMFQGVISLVTSYKPAERNSFQWKGHTYILPETIRQSFGQVLEGGNMTVGEAADALQLEHIFSSQNPDGTPVIEDAKYHNDIALVATLCRRLNPDGTIETPPLEFIARRRYFDERLELFSELPMDVAIDVAFFLTGSNPVLNRIHRLRSLLNLS